MKKDNYITLIYKSLKGEVDAKEQAQLESWLKGSEENRLLKTKVEKEWSSSKDYEPELDIDLKGDFQQLQQRIRRAKQTKNAKVRPINTRRSWLAIAAAIALVISTSWWFFNIDDKQSLMHLAETQQGEKTVITLKDGSRVWLNEGSRLSYPETFSDTERLVHLDGEAFFEVEKKPAAPFVIETNLAAVSVLGTSFHLNARQNTTQVAVTVMTGKVKLNANTTDQSIILEKGDTGVFDADKNSIKKSNDTDPNNFAWQTGILRFKDKTLETVIAEIGQLFKAEISIHSSNMKQCIFTGRLQDKTLEGMLENISDAFQMSIEQKTDSSFQLNGGVCE